MLRDSKENSVVRDYSMNSNNIVINKAGDTIYTANIDVGTVTVVDRETKEVTAEIKVGDHPEQLAISPDEKFLYVTCRRDNKVDVVSLEKQKVVDSIEVGIEPYGVVTSQDGKTLYVANYRSNTVSVVDLIEEEERKTIKVGNRPRTLSITADGKKLYTPHYLSGEISVIDTKTEKVSKVIKLADSPDQKDPKKSQGIPNTLEQFVISPDGKKAWVPHLLTNVDTPINFEETIFPAISVIDLTTDEEIVEERKELFQEINVTDKSDQTMIVSNPYDVVFSPDGNKAYTVMSGSEDLVVFDLARGGNATQIVRRIEGNNPRGAVITPDGKNLFVHNAMSHDLASVSTGGNDSYARAKMDGENLSLIEKDPLEPEVRKGKTIFYSANSDEYATEITGNNWVSCVSCHADGEMNGLTLTTPKGPRNIPSNTVTSETGLFLWDGSRDDFTDYILTVQGEMGGMTEFDAGKPLPAEVEEMYDAMFAFLSDPESFPPPQSPYREKDGSLSDSAKAGKELFEGKGNCLSCHGGKQFSDSMKAVEENGELTTDNTKYLYDIGTMNKLDKPSKGDARAANKNPRDTKHFDTPTLRGVWATAPYFHDGSAKTIEEAIERHGNDSVPTLTKGEMIKIAEYVRSIE
ncbi:beta-propeller fold lactonase family protein [Pseudalkalibacillus caeni]|uniref:Cytochrome c peroxidase n=1 Tax=Exobacillus caeni TaxID=2574798 RepID=A0A5R9F8Y4_9BACL|nr:beta-propeller fold lactonase family protein [Pseudalkalibacillus caeni]TLS37303.1 cytochrome c peroxidase [Pseudalkalibacillus caeni]